MVNEMITNVAEMPAELVPQEQQQTEEIVYPEQSIGVPLIENAKMSMRNVDVFYGEKQAIFNVSRFSDFTFQAGAANFSSSFSYFAIGIIARSARINSS